MCTQIIPAEYFACPYCGHLQAHTIRKEQQHTVVPNVAGIFFILSAISDFICGADILMHWGVLSFLGLIVIILGIFPLIAAFLCMNRKGAVVVLISAIVGGSGIGYWGTGLIFGIIGLLLLMACQSEFKDR
ncbi:MAG: hypothetical protein AB1665_02755 [Candidatus Thermoplasmatota archaeon]